jgi:drug/metabolite transporter (DMT)-like permease
MPGTEVASVRGMPSLLAPRRAARQDATRRALALGGTAALAGTAFGALGVASARRITEPIDEAVRERAARPKHHPARRIATAPLSLGKWWAYVPAALGLATWLVAAPPPRRGPRRRPRRDQLPGAAAVVGAGVAAAALAQGFDRWLPQPPAPPGHDDPDKPVYPSGHTFGPATVALTAAYVLAREGRARGGVAIPAALAVPLVTAGGKLVQQRHWATDVLGGYLGAVAVAAACLTGYELTRRR